MPRGKKELAEQIIPKLREVEVEVRRGKTVAESVKKIGVTEQMEEVVRRPPEESAYRVRRRRSTASSAHARGTWRGSGWSSCGENLGELGSHNVSNQVLIFKDISLRRCSRKSS